MPVALLLLGSKIVDHRPTKILLLDVIMLLGLPQGRIQSVMAAKANLQVQEDAAGSCFTTEGSPEAVTRGITHLLPSEVLEAVDPEAESRGSDIPHRQRHHGEGLEQPCSRHPLPAPTRRSLKP